MPTKTEPKEWERKGHFVEVVLPALGGRIPKATPTLPKRVCSRIVKTHFPNLPKSETERAAEGINTAVQMFLIAANTDAQPLPANIKARMESLEKAAVNLLTELQDCDDLTYSAIAEKAETAPPLPLPKPEQRKRYLMDYLYARRENESMDPPDRIINQLRQYAPLFAEMAKNAGTLTNSRKKTALPTLIRELKSVWKVATGKDSKGDSAFTNFVEAVTETEQVSKVAPSVGLQRLKLRRIINNK
jgi:hypothetical protein